MPAPIARTLSQFSNIATISDISQSLSVNTTTDRRAALQQALNEGTLKMFNREFRRRRLAAQAKGVPFMTYQTAQAKLRRVVTEMVSRGGLVTQSLIVSVFDSK